MNKINWGEIALHSEIEYSKARGGKPTKHKNFIHIYNKQVPYSGDYNRAVGVKISDYKSFEKVVEEVEKIHSEKKLDKPDRYDIYPPAMKEENWQGYLSKRGYNIHTVVFLCSRSFYKPIPEEIKLYLPSKNEYIKWYYEQQNLRSHFDEEYFNLIKPSQLNFIKIFKPYWLIEKDMIKGWVYCANLGEYCRLFEVEIKEEFRGCGLGTILLNAIRNEAGKQNAKYVLLSTGEDLRKFYEKAGFIECVKNSVIRLKVME
ncbi:MAG: GNAT family N-acetyltransferase [bacterium]